MATLDLSALEPVLKTDYLKGVNDNSVRSTVLLKHINRDSENVGGNFAQLALLRRGNPGVGSRAEGATLPTPNYSKHAKATFGMQTIYGRGRVSGKGARAAGKGDEVAFVDAIDAELQSLAIDLPAEHNRMLYGDGSGSLTACEVNNNTTTIQVDSVQYIQVDDVLDIETLSSGADIVLAVTVTAVDRDAVAFTHGGAAATTATTDSVFKAGSRLNEIYGLQNSHNTANPSVGTNFGSIDRTTGTNEFWQGNILDASGVNRPLTRGLMSQAVMKSHTMGKGNIDMIVCDPDMWTTYGVLLAPDQRFNDLIIEIDGGFKALNFVQIPVVFDKDCPPNMMFFSDLSALFLFEYEEGYQFMEADGHILRYTSSGEKDEVNFALLKDAQYGSRACNRQVWLKDLEVNVN